MKTEGKLVQCDYPDCEAHVMLAKTGEGETDGGYTRYNKYEPMPEGWGYTDGKDLCPDHWQYYQDTLHSFWHPVEAWPGKHALTETEADTLAEMIEADVSIVEPELKDEDILYTNMPGIKVKGPEGSVDAHVEGGEDW